MALHQQSDGTNVLPPQAQLLPSLIDRLSEADPQRLYAEVPASPTTYAEGWREVTYRDLANAINGVAWLLDDKLGRGKNHNTIAYIGPNDLAYIVMILGASKAGYQILSVSPRNTVADHISLFRATGCHSLLCPSLNRSPIVASITEEYPVGLIDSPSLYDLLDGTFPHYPYNKNFEEAKHEPLVALHTSGTTGVPKPIVYTHEFASKFVAWTGSESPEGFRSLISLLRSSRLFMTLPFFHAGNLFASLFYAPFNQTTIVTPLSGAVPSAKLIIDALKRVQVDLLVLAPPFLETIASEAEMLNLVTKSVDTIFYSGGGISETAGDAFTFKVRLFNMHGSTETGVYPTICPSYEWPSRDWRYIQPHPNAGIEFRTFGNDKATSEAVIVRKPSSEHEQPVFALFPEQDEYCTRDLFAPHPSKPGLWAHQGRTDDVIVFKPGYMCNPIIMEQHVAQHTEVRSVLMTGTGRFQPALLVEPATDRELSAGAKEELVYRLWPLISEANEKYKIGARVSRSHVIILDQGMTMRHAGKGTVQRAPTIYEYKAVLDDLYIREGDTAPGNDLALPLQGHNKEGTAAEPFYMRAKA